MLKQVQEAVITTFSVAVITTFSVAAPSPPHKPPMLAAKTQATSWLQQNRSQRCHMFVIYLLAMVLVLHLELSLLCLP
jgi:hypothetical protein